MFEALANPHQLTIIAILTEGRHFVSQLAHEAEMSCPLLYMHLQNFKKTRIVKTEMEILKDGKAMKYDELEKFDFHITYSIMKEAVKTLTIKKKKGK